MRAFHSLFAVGGCILTATSADYPCHDSWEAPADYIFPNIRTTGPANITFKPHVDACLHDREALDKPRVLPRPNATNFDIRGFDAVSRANLNESVTVVFYLATGDSVPSTTSPVSAKLLFSFADGSVESFQIDAVDSEKGAALMHTEGAGSSGSWGTTGASWKGSFDGDNYAVKVNSAQLGIRGTLNLTSIAPSRYPCATELTDTTTLELVPGLLGWTNQIPDAKASADSAAVPSSTRKTKTLSFDDGTGWHDQTWSSRPWSSVVKNWVFGRASIGSGTFDSINWFQGEDRTGKVHTSAYIARDGKTIMTMCETVDRRGQEKLVKIKSAEKRTMADIALADETTYKVEIYKDLELEGDGKGNGRWSGVAVGGQLRGQGIVQEGSF